MADEPESTPEPTPAPKRRSAQDKKLEADIIRAEQLINALQAEQEVKTDLAEGGYAPEELTRISLVQKKALGDYLAHGEAEGAQKAATRAMQSAERSVRTTYRKLRGLGKAAFMKDPNGRQQLRLDGREPDGLPNFIGAARALAQTGLKPEYAAKLAKKGVTAAKLAALSSKIDALESADLA